jgi:2-phosphosulfolactate phosphatase
MANSIEVVLSPALLQAHEVHQKTVVIIDILRATSSMCVAFKTGVNKILPVAGLDECLLYREFDFLCAGERDAQKVEGFDLGNSPFEFTNPILAGRNIAFTTTNGTKAIKMARSQGAAHILIGSFLNLTAVFNQLSSMQHDVVLLCAGWKDKVNLEDTLFAGALTSMLRKQFTSECDAALSSALLYEQNRHRLDELVRQSSHARRFKLLEMQTDDVAFCLQQNICTNVPKLKGEYIFAS